MLAFLLLRHLTTPDTVARTLRPAQEFVELVRSGERCAAVAYARAHFPAHSSAHMQQIQQAMATTAFASAAAASSAYGSLFAEAAWASLERQFLKEHRRLNCAPERPPLLLALSAGLAVLRNAACADRQREEEEGEDTEPDGGGNAGGRGGRASASRCPACSPECRPLCARLPCAHHTRSSLLCEVSGAPMDEDNPPYALPNGRLVSAAALRGLDAPLAGAPAAGLAVVDPHSGERFQRVDLRKVFIV